jgi:DNA polymerase-1
MNTEKTITVIDTFGFLFRSFYALPPLKSKTGFPTGLLTGFMNFVANIGKDFQTDYIVFALDSKGNTFRNEIYPQYKAHRPDVPEDLLAQLPVAISWIEKMGFKTVAIDGFEADDIIASIAHDASTKGFKVRVVSHDKDLYQLINDESVFLFDPIKKKEIKSHDCFEKYGVTPQQFTDYQSLLGDSADNVPGVKGVGAKTAQALIEQFGSLDNIYANLDNIEKPRWVKLLNESKEMAYISKQLVTLKTDSHVLDELEELTLPKENPILKIEDILIEYDMNRIVDRVHQNGLNYKTSVPTHTLQNNTSELQKVKSIDFEAILLNDEKELFEIIQHIPKDALVAFDTETTDVDTKNAKLVGFSFCFDDKKAYYVPVGHFYLGVPEQISLQVAKKAIELLNERKLVVQNFKYDYDVIKYNLNIELSLFSDTMILAWLLDPASKVGLDALSDRFFDHKMIAFKDVVKKGENFSNIDIHNACEYAAEDAFVTLRVYHKLIETLKHNGCEHLIEEARTYEYDFIKVLASMQEVGIKIDTDFLEKLKTKNNEHIQNLSAQIYALSGTEFNINSPKQLGVILFETLGLKAGKKNQNGLQYQ